MSIFSPGVNLNFNYPRASSVLIFATGMTLISKVILNALYGSDQSGWVHIFYKLTPVALIAVTEMEIPGGVMALCNAATIKTNEAGSHVVAKLSQLTWRQ